MNIYVHNLKAMPGSVWFVERRPGFASNAQINVIINNGKKNTTRLQQSIELTDSVNWNKL